MTLIFSADAKREIECMPADMQTRFISHLEKLELRPPRKHLKYGIPCHVGNVSKQAGIIFVLRADKIYILHCFTSHKDYENWYKSYK